MLEDSNDIIYSPYAAAMADRTMEQREQFLTRFSSLPDEVREFFTSEATVEAIKSIMDSSELPGDYDLAISKIVAFAAIGDVPPMNIESLLVKLEVPPEQASSLSQKLLKLLSPVISARAVRAVPNMPELPPLSQHIPPASSSPDSSQPPTRNIIDLRKQTPTS